MTSAGRASAAVRMLKNNRELGRAFDNCFEEGDGDEVVARIIHRCKDDGELVYAIYRHGYEKWLEPGYLASKGIEEQKTDAQDGLQSVLFT
jgi:hypothetical protein